MASPQFDYRLGTLHKRTLRAPGTYIPMSNRDLWEQKDTHLGYYAIQHGQEVAKLIYQYITALQEWDKTMAQKTYRIELKIDFNDDSLHAHMEKVAARIARDFVSSAMLLQDGRHPNIAIITDSHFYGREDIEVMSEEDAA